MKILGLALGWIMVLCFAITGNYGFSIILFTLLTKVILFPVSILTQKNSIKMVKMMPEENALKIKYVDNKDKLTDAQLELYKKYHYNPFLGVIPLLIQIPLVLGLVYVVYHPLNYVLRMDSGVIEQLRQWLMSVNNVAETAENSYQLEIIGLIQQGTLPGGALASAAEAIRGLDMSFCGIDLSLTPSFKENFILLLIPFLSGASAWFMCHIQNKINVLQVSQSKLNMWLMTAFMVAFSTYFAFLVPAGVGIYWIFGNLFAIPSMLLLNAVMPPKKYIDYDYLLSMKAQRVEKEKIYRQYHSRERADYKRFVSDTEKRLVFYSEQNGFYKYYSGMIDYICSHSDLVIHYVTSDPNDNIFKDSREQIRAYYVATDRYLIPLFMKLECDIFVMTVPDLEKYHLKRSRVKEDIEYIFVSHGMGSTAMTFRKGALDWYDTVFCPGIDTLNEIRDAEELYNTPKKCLVETGYPLIDEMIAKYDSEQHAENAVPKILIAPSWQPDNIIDVCAETLLDKLSAMNYDIILRPHPQQVRHEPEKFELLKEKYADRKNVEIQTDFSSNSPIMESDLLITDWSDISWEFAFVTLRPVLFINTPMKVMNPEYDLIKTKPINITLRNVIGRSVEPDAIDSVGEVAAELLNRRGEYRGIIEKTRGERIFNIGKSSVLCARYIMKSLEGTI